MQIVVTGRQHQGIRLTEARGVIRGPGDALPVPHPLLPRVACMPLGSPGQTRVSTGAARKRALGSAKARSVRTPQRLAMSRC